MSAPTENALQDVRAEWVEETTPGTPPSNPSWNRFSDYIAGYTWGGDAGVQGQNVVGQGDFADHFRGSEEHDLEINYWMQRFPIDASGNIQGPEAVPMEHDYNTDYDSHTVVIRREVTEGGVDGAGFREFIVAVGARPTSITIDGDPSASEPLPEQLGYTAEQVRQYVVHQPADGTQLDLASTSANDTMDVTIESEGGSTTETVTLSGTTTVTTTSSFSDIDAIYVASEPEGDITAKDDAGNDLLEDPIVGSNTDNVEGYQGIPALGTGSHASAIGTDPESYLFLGTSVTYGGGTLSDRIHTFNFSVEVDVTLEPQQGTRSPAVDVGPRTVTFEADVAGPYESAAENYNYYVTDTGDIVYTLPDGDITGKNATRVDTDDVDRSAGDANQLYGETFECNGDPAISLSHN